MAEFSIIPEKDMVKIIKSKMIKNPRYRDTVIIDMRKKLKKVKENIKNCNVNTLNDLCKISNIVDIHSKYMYTDPSFDLLNRDVMDTQQEFIDNCKITSSTKVDKFKLSTKIIKK